MVGILKDNINKVLEQEAKMSELDSRSGKKFDLFWLFCVFSEINVYLLDNKGIDHQNKRLIPKSVATSRWHVELNITEVNFSIDLSYFNQMTLVNLTF